MKNCVVTASYACPPQKVWLYLTNPNLNSWRSDLSGAEVSPDGAAITERGRDGTVTEVKITESEKARRLRGVECTLSVEGMGLFAKPKKGLEAHFEMLRSAIGG